MIRFIKDWTLPLAMMMGVLGYFCFTNLDVLYCFRPIVKEVASWLTPSLIFAQLLLTFCKVAVKDLSPRGWMWPLLGVQFVGCLLSAAILLFAPLPGEWKIALEGAMVCIIAPTATAAAVITGKLGGSAAALTTYTLMSNLLAAVMVPLVFPLVEPSDLTFGKAFLTIMGRVFPLLLFPFFISVILRRYFPLVYIFLSGLKDMAFYLWALALVIVMGQTTRTIVEGNIPVEVELLVAFLALIVCCLQFLYGKRVGGRVGERVSGGQALGQKNTVLAIWMALTYLNPISAIAPGSYMVWQNLINSWQLWKKNRLDNVNKD